MKKCMTLLLALCLLCGVCTANAGGFVPSLTDVYGVDMPSLSYVLKRLPDKTETQFDGSSTVTYTGVTEGDYDAFSVYLAEYGCELADYTVEGNNFCFILQKEGSTFTFEYNNETQTAVLTYPAGCNEDMTWAQDIYNEATAALERKDYAAAGAALEQIKGYKDVDSILADWENEIAAATRRAAYKTPGEYVTFGNYYQSNSSTKEPIEWLVLDYDASTNRALVISRYGLDCKRYNEERVDITWETCTLRTWLNGEFLNAAFSTAEQKAIPTVTVSADKNPSYSTNPGNATQDKVFCLSITEVNKYFKNDEARKCAPTQYAINNNAYTSGSYKVDGKATCYWWLRSPVNFGKYAAIVNLGGTVYSSGDGVNRSDNAVRPALYIDLNLIP